MQAPTATELLIHVVVQQAMQQAWADSLPQDPDRRHEEGGWIYMDVTTGEITVRLAPSGAAAAIDLRNPVLVAGSLVVGKFHTHPNPTAEGWAPGPSEGDIVVDDVHGVPDLIRADDGIHFSGPAQRRGGLSGNWGYPT